MDTPQNKAELFNAITHPRLKRVARLSVALEEACQTEPDLTRADVVLACLTLASCSCLDGLNAEERATVMSDEARSIGAVGGMVIVKAGLDKVAHVLVGLGDALKAEAFLADANEPATPHDLDTLMADLSNMINKGHA